MLAPPSTMRAAVYKGERTIAVEDVAVPDVGPNQVLLEISHCGICGSDLHLMVEDWGTPGSVGGHEYSGTVVGAGSDVKGWVAGDRAVGGPGQGCGDCELCTSGRPNLCERRSPSGATLTFGAFAAYKLVDSAALYRVPEPLDLRTAALTEPVAVALHGVRRAGSVRDGPVLVTGGGPIGLLTVAVLRASGFTDVTVSEPAEKRKALARQVGATTVVSPEELAPPASPMSVASDPFHAAFECSGRPDAVEAALANLDRGGTLVLSGTGMRRPRLDMIRVILHELTITGTVEYTPEDYYAALDLLVEGRLPTTKLIEPEDQPLERLQWAMDQLSKGELAGKVMVVPGA